MSLRLVLALTAVLGSMPVVVAQHGLGPDSGMLTVFGSSGVEATQAKSSASRPTLECMVGIGRATAPTAGRGSPVRETRFIGAAAAGNLVCLRS